MSALDIRVRSIGEARPLVLSGWATAIVSAVDEPSLAVERPPFIEEQRHLVVCFDDVTHPSFGTVVDASTVRAVVDFGRTLDDGTRVLVHCRGGIGRSPACAIALHLAHGTTMAEAIQLVVADRPQAQPNPLFVLVLDEVLGATGELWHDYHQWAYRQPWWISGLEPDPSRSASATRSALRAQTHRTRQQ